MRQTLGSPRGGRLHIDPPAPWRRLIVGGAGFVGLLVFGVAGYMLIEGWSFLDALYMTVVSVTTVGYSEVRPLSDSGRVFTIFVIFFGVGMAFYILTAVVQAVVEGELGQALGVRRMESKIEALRDHYILCGFGRVGEEIARRLGEHNAPFVIIDSNPQAAERARRHGHLLIEGDATQDSVLEEAGIRRARGLMAASDSDADNTYITLTAKALTPDIIVAARAGQPSGEPRLRRAGADAVISPSGLAGRRMVLSALQPLMVDFIDLLTSGNRGEQLLAELVVVENSLIAGQEVHQALHDVPATTLLAIQHADGEVLVGPPSSYALRPGDRLMLLSREEEMETLGRTNRHGSAP